MVEIELCNQSFCVVVLHLLVSNLCPWWLRKLFAEIEDGCRHIAEIQFAVTNHKKNRMVETLAKASMSRKNFFKAAW
ncbi:hypothetical protein J1N35_009596 [Gossypium stocksii]|uniref:RNase H type-1 domain-containing protein n=1 Tax=Gossypium stocksii TaxID=47602 RepID=A0A9D3W0U8_9ROSI|nr:hypothetical protein J1N35_009596 [Gossypium stocksii]